MNHRLRSPLQRIWIDFLTVKDRIEEESEEKNDEVLV